MSLGNSMRNDLEDPVLEGAVVRLADDALQPLQFERELPERGFSDGFGFDHEPDEGANHGFGPTLMPRSESRHPIRVDFPTFPAAPDFQLLERLLDHRTVYGLAL